MASYLLASAIAKINRAKKHLAELTSAVEAYHERRPYRVAIDAESMPGHEVYRFRIIEPIPVGEWGSMVGDVIHNLRSALDNLAAAMVISNGRTGADVVKNTYFPISSSREGFPEELAKNMRGASPKVRNLVKRLKPYKGGIEAFWRLHRLDVLDKHTVLIPVGVSHTAFAMVFDNDKIFKEVFGLEPIGMAPSVLKLSPSNRQFPLNDGDVIGSYGSGPDTEDKRKPDFQFTFDIGFGEGQIIDGEPVVESLEQFVNFVERVVKIFETFLSRDRL